MIAKMDANKGARGRVSGSEVEKHVRGMEKAKAAAKARIAELVGVVAEVKSKVDTAEAHRAKAAEKENSNMLSIALEKKEAEIVAQKTIDVKLTDEVGEVPHDPTHVSVVFIGDSALASHDTSISMISTFHLNEASG